MRKFKIGAVIFLALVVLAPLVADWWEDLNEKTFTGTTTFDGKVSFNDTIVSHLYVDGHTTEFALGVNADSEWIQADCIVPHTTGAFANPQDVYFIFGTVTPQIWTMNNRLFGAWEYYGDNGLTFKISNELWDSCSWGRRDSNSVYDVLRIEPTATINLKRDALGVTKDCAVLSAHGYNNYLSIGIENEDPFLPGITEVTRFYEDSIRILKPTEISGNCGADGGIFRDSILLPQYNGALPASPSSGFCAMDTANDTLIAMIGGTRAIVYPQASGGGFEFDSTLIIDHKGTHVDTLVSKWHDSQYYFQIITDYGGARGITIGHKENACPGTRSAIVGGWQDTIGSASDYSFIGGGYRNKIDTEDYAGVIGGCECDVYGNYGFIGGGKSHYIHSYSDYSGICGGFLDSINYSQYSGILGGYKNIIGGSSDQNSSMSAIITGYQNWIKRRMAGNSGSVILGGQNNQLQDPQYCVAMGNGSTIDTCQSCFVGNTQIRQVDSVFAWSKEIWAMKGNDTTIITAKKVASMQLVSKAQQTITLGNGAATFEITSNVIAVTGDAAGNTIATITGAAGAGVYTFIFTDDKVTISNNDTHGDNTVDLDGANDFTSADDKVLLLCYDGTSWYKVSESAN